MSEAQQRHDADVKRLQAELHTVVSASSEERVCVLFLLWAEHWVRDEDQASLSKEDQMLALCVSAHYVC